MQRGHLNAQVNFGETLASDSTLPMAERNKGVELLRAAARDHSAQAQAILRRWGDKEIFPTPINMELPMTLESRDPTAGRSSVCGALVS
jgi:hypothetical protein